MRLKLLAPVSLVLVGGCVFGYTRVPEPAGVDTQPTSEVHVWTHGQLLKLHGTTMLLDSITGIPTKDPLTCDECRIGLPLTEVDSVFLQRQTGNDVKSVGKALLLSALMYGL
jgi:hypothetical protein